MLYTERWKEMCPIQEYTEGNVFTSLTLSATHGWTFDLINMSFSWQKLLILQICVLGHTDTLGICSLSINSQQIILSSHVLYSVRILLEMLGWTHLKATCRDRGLGFGEFWPWLIFSPLITVNEDLKMWSMMVLLFCIALNLSNCQRLEMFLSFDRGWITGSCALERITKVFHHRIKKVFYQ